MNRCSTLPLVAVTLMSLSCAGPNVEQDRKDVQQVFEKYLRGKRITCTLRRSRGLDIEGACGQLRLRRERTVVK